ncbi:unnamed protein product [Lepidochelys olivacea]
MSLPGLFNRTPRTLASLRFAACSAAPLCPQALSGSPSSPAALVDIVPLHPHSLLSRPRHPTPHPLPPPSVIRGSGACTLVAVPARTAGVGTERPPGLVAGRWIFSLLVVSPFSTGRSGRCRGAWQGGTKY